MLLLGNYKLWRSVTSGLECIHFFILSYDYDDENNDDNDCENDYDIADTNDSGRMSSIK